EPDGMSTSRNTAQRRAIERVLIDGARPLAPQEVLAAAQSQTPGLGLATVYRTLRAMVEDGRLRAVEMPGQAQRYECAGIPHHHHFQCTSCGKVFDIEGCALAVKPDLPKGFKLEDHEVFLYGRCDACTA